MNPKFTYSYMDAQWTQPVFGFHINLTYPPGEPIAEKVSTQVVMSNLPLLIDHIYTNLINATKMAESNCEILEKYCPDVFTFNEFADQKDCIRQMNSLPLLETNNAGLNTVDSNTTGCRHLHSSMAMVNPEEHCHHISFRPVVDSRGKTKCSITANYNNKDLFTEEDFFLLERIARSNDLNPVTCFGLPSSVEELGTCDDSDFLIERSDIVLPLNFMCKNYLALQVVDGDHNVTYWIILWGLVVGLRILSIFFLRFRISSHL